MTADELPIWALESELRATGYDCERSGAILPFPALALECCVQTPDLSPFGEGFTVAVVRANSNRSMALGRRKWNTSGRSVRCSPQMRRN